MKEFKSEFKCFGLKGDIYVPACSNRVFDSYQSALESCLKDSCYCGYSKYKIVELITIEREVVVFSSNVIGYAED